jgi:methyltransferase OMS1, mitochondrial
MSTSKLGVTAARLAVAAQKGGGGHVWSTSSRRAFHASYHRRSRGTQEKMSLTDVPKLWMISGVLFFVSIGYYGTNTYYSMGSSNVLTAVQLHEDVEDEIAPQPKPSAAAAALTSATTVRHNSDGTTFTETAAPSGLPPMPVPQIDSSLSRQEWITGIKSLRRELAAKAHGHVLEVACGTGRNLPFMDWDDMALAPPAGNVGLGGDAGAADTVRRSRQFRKLRKSKGGMDGVSPEVASYTGVDINAETLEVARVKLRNTVPGAKALFKNRRKVAWGTGPKDAEGRQEILNVLDGRLRLVRLDATEVPLPLAPAGVSSAGPSRATPPAGPWAQGKYDTVVQSFGLCSVADPAALLRVLAGVVVPETGRIYLLEHGRSEWELANQYCDGGASSQFARWGCWWNRDLEAIIRSAADTVPGLELVDLRRPYAWRHWGTTIVAELRMRDGAAERAASGAAKGAEDAVRRYKERTERSEGTKKEVKARKVWRPSWFGKGEDEE